LGLSLIAAVSLSGLLDLGLVILEVAFALGMVIFVHELGHFAVAKWCGVKCEKFYLGFDIYGLKLWKRQWGETEYGIGALPLGGYVKMLGQDDNPGRAAAERERSQLPPDPDEVAMQAAVERETLDPRSYLAKSVPQRMAIISAGVVMNVIFAFICAVTAYSLGVPETACGVSATMPGEPAWRADLQPGDRVLEIGDNAGPLRFRDLMSAVALGDMTHGVDFLIQREGVEKPFWVNIKPDKIGDRLVPMIGVAGPLTTKLDRKEFVDGGTPAAQTGKFEEGDQIVAVDGRPVETYAQVLAELYRHNDQKVTITVERKGPQAADSAATKTERIDVDVEPQKRVTLGVAMTMGRITAIQDDSPAAEAGLRAGDLIGTIDGQALGDPLRLADELRRRAGETVTLVVLRKGASGEEKVEKQIKLRDRPWPEESMSEASPVAIPALGLTYKVVARVREVEPGGPAAKAKFTKDGQAASGLAPGDEIVEASLELPELSKEELEKREADKTQHWITRLPKEGKTIELSADKPNWPFLMTWLQQLPAGTKVTLTLKDGRTGTLLTEPAADWYYFDRGFRYGSDTMTIRADSFGQAVTLGRRETIDALSMVYKFLRRLGSGQVSAFALGGPGTIAAAAGGAAYEGVSSLLLFLTLLSANLAVVNFLPIPLLDGGHMVFLILEGIMRRPVSEKVVIAFHYAGFVFIISLMIFVLGLDFTRFLPG
jgi:regulator of sigma E protease